MLYSGFSDTVSQEEEEYIYNRYGIFDKIEDDKYVPFCESFESYLSQLYRKNPYSLLWGKAERCIRSIIKYALKSETEEEDYRLWDHEIRPLISTERWVEYTSHREYEKRLWRNRASDCLVDQFYTSDYIYFIREYWDDYIKAILGGSLQHWETELEFICKYVRNTEAHSRLLLNSAEKTRATLFCNEVIKRCKCHEEELGEIE